MPEGDTVYRTAIRLRTTLAGQVLVRTDFRIPSLATADLAGGRVTAVRSHGKHLLVDVERDGRTASIHSHLGMEGAWQVYRRGDRWRRPAFTARVVLETDAQQCVGFELAELDIFDDPESALRHLGPDLLGSDWDPDEAVRRIAAHPDQSVGVALLDQTLMAGVGNVYRSEVCFLRGVLPTRLVAEVDLPPLVALCHRLLYANRERVARVTTGDAHRGRQLWVYGRRGQPCRRCGTLIMRDEMGAAGSARVVYYCPQCQT